MIFKPRSDNHRSYIDRRSFLRGLSLLTGALAAQPSLTWGSEPLATEGQSSDTLKRDALQRIPQQAMTASAQAKIQSVVNHATYFRRMPQRTIDCDQELFKQFVRYPELLIGIWDAMGATRVEIERIAPYIFRADDAAGTRCVAELLYGNESIHVYYSTGDYTGKLVPRKIDGRSLCVVHSQSKSNPDGRNLITLHLDVFLKLDSIGADLVVRTLAPMMGATADQNYVETLKFLSQLSDACVNNPFGVRGLVDRVQYVLPEVKEKFIAEVYLAADRANRVAAGNSDSVTQQR